ncbi:conserved hypothetical protein [Talaromyces stipitatus ATCC 10500]|uniref:AB hydrolase-1 domain-containing protein n=1 Tax=Talaromyces stipitatus (strain ATCC 10500 / CBS 375.48 / QM 6759 / NRRL 1006) TaxID=441959 RepID=B8MMR0_TALSN|nr:uncharacterized protein TSTA_100600 [Talaromyces stipitatus ATCC 10500]EED13816.1 conserved hypothetical protein [Talaromyces stipitatus ATCC 10500]
MTVKATRCKPEPHASSRGGILGLPASFAPPLLYSEFVQQLKYDFNATVLDLPYVGLRDPLPPASIMDDAEHIKSATTRLADEGCDIISHAVGKLGGIMHLVYIGSPAPEVGGSMMMIMDEKLSPFMKLEIGEDKIIFKYANNKRFLRGGYLTSDPEGYASINISDLPYADSIQHAGQMKAHSAESFSGPLHYAGYLNTPVTYIMCERDISVTPEFQRSVIDMISANGGKEVTTLLCNSRHFPNMSDPDELADLINTVTIQG